MSVLLQILRDIFERKPPAGLPRDEGGFDRLMRDLMNANRARAAFDVYESAVDAGLHSCGPVFDDDYRRAMEATGSVPYPLRRRTRFHRLYLLLGEALRLDGAIAECGCFRGLSSRLMLSRLKRADPAYSGEGYHVFDSFEGLSEPGAHDLPHDDDAASQRLRQMCRPGWFAAPLELVRRGLAGFPAVTFHPGWIPQSFAGLPELKYRFVHLDLDLYAPTLAALEYFHPRLLEGAIVVCDDYSWPGGRKAIDEFCAQREIAFESTPQGQAVLRNAR